MEDEPFAHYEVKQNWRRREGSCCSCSLGEGELYCSSIDPVTKTSASGPMPSSFETDHYTNCHPQSFMQAKEKSNACRMETQSWADMSCSVYFSSEDQLLISLFWCGGHSTTTLDNFVLNYSYTVLYLTFYQRSISFRSLDKYLKTPRYPVQCLTHGKCQYDEQTWDREMGEKEKEKVNSL